MDTNNFKPGDKVKYRNLQTYEFGIVSSINESYVFVKFIDSNLTFENLDTIQSKAVSPEFLTKIKE